MKMSLVTTVSIPRKKAHLIEEAKQISKKSMSKLFTEFLEHFVADSTSMTYLHFALAQTEDRISEINFKMDALKKEKKAERQRARGIENKIKDGSMKDKEYEAEKEIFDQLVEAEAQEIFSDYHGQKTMESCRRQAEKIVEEKMKLKGRVD